MTCPCAVTTTYVGTHLDMPVCYRAAVDTQIRSTLIACCMTIDCIERPRQCAQCTWGCQRTLSLVYTLSATVSCCCLVEPPDGELQPRFGIPCFLLC